MNPEMKIIREVSIEAEDFYEQAVKLGDHAAEALKARHRSQMTGLENIAESTFKTSDVFDYIKKQTARFSHWRQPFSELKNSNQGFGERLKAYLENELAERCNKVCTRLPSETSPDKEKQRHRHIYLLLIRQFIRSMIVEYEYQVNVGPKVNSRKES